MFIFESCDNNNPIIPIYGDQPAYPPADGFPAWSPNGKRIIYNHYGITRVDIGGSYHVNYDSSGLWMINSDGTNPHLIIRGVDINADWSPGGKWIVFEKNAQIYKVPVVGDSVDTSQIQQLTFEGRNFFPAWSPDGKWITYSNTIGDTIGVWISPTDGSGSKTYFTFGGQPDWFPDGQRILYGNRGIWIEKLDHSSKTQIYSDSVNRIANPTVSPDGLRIAFDLNCQIWVMDSDGTDLTKITVEGLVVSQPFWSPDGSKIVCIGWPETKKYDPRNNGTLWIINADGTNKRQLTYGPLPQ